MSRLRVVLAAGWVVLAACAAPARTAGGGRLADEPGPEVAPAPELEAEWAAWPWPTPPLPLPPSASEERLVARAARLVGLKSLKPVAPHLPDDCTGLARAVYEDVGFQLMGAGRMGDNGVTAIYRLALERGALHAGVPAPGDLAFFEETYDRNRDGQRNDGLTHVAVVESVDADGTVTFVHRGGSGVARAKLNLHRPLDPKANDWLRPARRGQPGQLAGELFVTWASARKLLDAVQAAR